jgi:hypothetical protein
MGYEAKQNKRPKQEQPEENRISAMSENKKQGAGRGPACIPLWICELFSVMLESHAGLSKIQFSSFKFMYVPGTKRSGRQKGEETMSSSI